jgi:MSHA biogenesis protein MshM
VYQVTPKHVKAAIKDSEFGTEQVKKGNTQKLYLAAAAILVLGLALGYLINIWQTGSADAIPMAESVAAQPAIQETASEVEPGSSTVSDNAVAEHSPQLAGSSDDILEHRLNVTQQWLNQQPASTVSIQLMGSANDNQMRAQLESLGSTVEIDNIYIYRTFVNKTPFLSVLYGSYQNRQEAVEAMRKLPESLRSYRPQLRTIGGILQETKPVQ